MIKLKFVMIGLLLAAPLLAGETGYHVTARYPVPQPSGFDYLTLDSAARRLYISHGTQVDVIDADSGKIIGAIGDTPGVHGIAIAPEFKHGFISNGLEDKVSMFDTTTLQLIKKIDVGKGPDGIWYDPGSKRVFTNDKDSEDITAIDAKTAEVVGTVKIGGNGEEAGIGNGLIYVNVENQAQVVVFDPKTLEIKNHFPIGITKPTGLANDPGTNRLFIGSNLESKMAVMDAVSGKVINTFPICSGVDYASFDPDAKLIFFSCGDGTLSIYHEKSADEYEDAGAIKTQATAKTMAFDPKTKKIFLSAGEYLETPSADPKRPLRSIKNGSFVVLVVSK
jgi:DNA-binding beta-propeller fold protein YncE